MNGTVFSLATFGGAPGGDFAAIEIGDSRWGPEKGCHRITIMYARAQFLDDVLIRDEAVAAMHW